MARQRFVVLERPDGIFGRFDSVFERLEHFFSRLRGFLAGWGDCIVQVSAGSGGL